MRAQMDFALCRISCAAFAGVGMQHLRTCPRRQRLVHVSYDVHAVSALFLVFGTYLLRRTLMLLGRNAWRLSFVWAAALSSRSPSTTLFCGFAREPMYRVAGRCLKTCGMLPVVFRFSGVLSRRVRRAVSSASSSGKCPLTAAAPS